MLRNDLDMAYVDVKLAFLEARLDEKWSTLVVACVA